MFKLVQRIKPPITGSAPLGCAEARLRTLVRDRQPPMVPSMLMVRLALAACLLVESDQLPAQSVNSADQVVLRFYADPQVSSDIVRLKDLVEVLSGDSPSLEKLKELPLGPAPREGATQTWYSSDILQHLDLRGVHSKSVRWSGGDSTVLTGVAALTSAELAALSPAYLDQRIIEIARGNVIIAIREHLNLRSRSRTDWRIEVDIEDQHVKLLQSRRNISSIGGGQEPWTGTQQFTLQVKQHGRLLNVPIEATIELPPMVVVAAGPIRRDQILAGDMLGYAPLPPNADPRHHFTDIQSVVRKQLHRSLSTNQPLTDDLLGEPLVIHRNDLVEVESVARHPSWCELPARA